MPSPYSTGGGGTHFEARVVATYLAATVCEAPARGVPGNYVAEIRTQRASFDEPLDDIIAIGRSDDGMCGTLFLQIKSKLAFTAKDREWVSVLSQAWETFNGDFDQSVDRLGVALGVYSAKADQHYQSVLSWATHSADGADFAKRIQRKDFSSSEKRQFVDAVREVLSSCAERAISDDELWRFLKRFVIIHFDLGLETGSRDEELVEDRIRNFLPTADRDKAHSIWDHLVTKAGRLIPTGGSASHETLSSQLREAHLLTGTSTSYWKDIDSVDKASVVALADIKADINGLRLHRQKAHQQIHEALDSGRFVQIVGQPGTGKSALLKEFAEEARQTGPVFVLKHDRIVAGGWDAHAHVRSVRQDVGDLLREFATAGQNVLFIDGIDRITDPAVHLTVNDVLRCIADLQSLAAWRILATVREQNLEHIKTWLDPDSLAKLTIKTVTVEQLDANERAVVASVFPRFRSLLVDPKNAELVLRRPFFLSVLTKFVGQSGDDDQAPATEVELVDLWWRLGASDEGARDKAQLRRNLLIQLAESVARSPNEPIPIGDFDPSPLEELKSFGVVVDRELGHSVSFAHDIYEEWALYELLVRELSSVAALLQGFGEPQIFARPLQLLGERLLERASEANEWYSLLTEVNDPALRPIWSRAVLTSCLQSPRSVEFLSKLDEHLMADNFKNLKKLLSAICTIEVRPNTTYLDETHIPSLGPSERAKFANLFPLPKPHPWIRFLDWFMARSGYPWTDLLMDLLPLFSVWQRVFGGNNIRHCREIGEVLHKWLLAFENRQYFGTLSLGVGGDETVLDYREVRTVESKIRSAFFASAGDIPDLVKAYLDEHRSKEQSHVLLEEIVSNLGVAARYVPSAVTDYFLAVFLENPEEEDQFRSDYAGLHDGLGLADDHIFYPASPSNGPFLPLLRANETEGLRLVREVCNHSIKIWRSADVQSRFGHQSVTPIPVVLSFDWGQRTFWGDRQVYLWFRGIWSSNTVGSALMALESWAFDQIDAGRSFDEVLRTVVDGNDSVAVLGIGVSLCLAYPDRAVSHILPLLTCPRVWMWDIERVLVDQSPLNTMGFGLGDQIKLDAVRSLNNRPHRRDDIRTAVPWIAISDDTELRDRYQAAVRDFPKNLPFEFEEERVVTERVEELEDRMSKFAQQADLEYWKLGQFDDGRRYIYNDAPYKNTENFRRDMERHNEFDRNTSLLRWASDALEKSQINERFTLEEAFSLAKELDQDTIFDEIVPTENIAKKHAQAVIVGTAFAIAKFADDQFWTDDIANWTTDVIQRAAVVVESSETLVRSSALSMHPVLFAVHGYAALLARSHEVRNCQVGLLNLAVDSLNGVVAAVASSANSYAAKYPEFYWLLFNTLLRQCLVHDGGYPNFYSVAWDGYEANRKFELLEWAEGALENDARSGLPEIPRSWIKVADGSTPDLEKTNGFQRNDDAFLQNLAEEAILKAPFGPLLVDGHRRSEFLRLVTDLLAYSIQEIAPPFGGNDEGLSRRVPYGWVYAFSGWLGKVAAHLPADEVCSIILLPIESVDGAAAPMIMKSFIPAFMLEGLFRSDLSDAQFDSWMNIADWVFKRAEAGPSSRQQFRDFDACAVTMLFCVGGPFQPITCGIDRGWPHLKRFEPTVEKAVEILSDDVELYGAITAFFKGGGFDLLPDPGLQWLADAAEKKKQDRVYWKTNGDDLVEILKMILDQERSQLTEENRGLISAISDILVDNGIAGAGFLQQDMKRA